MNRLEISVSTSGEAIIAEQGGAHRLELAIKSEQGGLTPDLKQISDVLAHTTLPCYILIRPRVDSYELTEQEFKQLLHIISIAKLTPAKGISIGLLKNGKVDKKKLEEVISVKGDLELVFNHAIDSTRNWDEEIHYLIEHDGVSWIQTTGSTETIIDGLSRLAPLMDKIKDKLIVGRAINTDNINKIFEAGINNVVYQCRTALNVYDGFNNSLSLEKVKDFSNILKNEDEKWRWKIK